MKKIALILMVTVLLLTVTGVLASCGEAVDDGSSPITKMPDSTESETTRETDFYEGLRGFNYEGYIFNVLTYESTGWETYAGPTEENGDVLNDAAYTRNTEIEEMLNIKIVLTRDSDSEKTFKNLVISGDDSAGELILLWSPGERSSFISENLTYDWKAIPQIKLDAEWYNHTANEAFTIAGKQYFAVSDYSFPVQQHFRILFNIGLAEQYHINSPYEDVFNGKWYFDTMLQDCKGIYSDLNGNGKADLDDTYGLVLNSAFSSIFPLNSGEIAVRSGDNGFEINIYSDRIVSIVEKIVAFKTNPDIYFNASGNDQYNIFYAGNALFMTYGSDPADLRDVEFDFGYLPYPKFDENQKDYVVWSAGGMMAISSIIKDTERTGVIVEALSRGSNKYVKEAFINKYIEGKVLRDEESQRIYRMMRDLATYDLSYNIDPANELAKYKYYSYFMTKGSSDVSSRYAEIGSKIEKAYSDLFELAKSR